jgi:ACS family sodium-dependent inorganic phosphate cotransporter
MARAADMVTKSVQLLRWLRHPTCCTQVPWAQFFKSPPVWAVTIAHFCFNWGYYTLLAWLPSYFELALGLNVEKSSILTLIPYVAMTAMMPLVGPVADGMVDRGVPLTSVRKICQGIAFVGPAACMIACALLTPTSVAVSASSAAPLGAALAVPPASVPVPLLVALMSLAFALSAWSRAGLYCNHQVCHVLPDRKLHTPLSFLLHTY